jgi:hypothetical protein
MADVGSIRLAIMILIAARGETMAITPVGSPNGIVPSWIAFSVRSAIYAVCSQRQQVRQSTLQRNQ